MSTRVERKATEWTRWSSRLDKAGAKDRETSRLLPRQGEPSLSARLGVTLSRDLLGHEENPILIRVICNTETTDDKRRLDEYLKVHHSLIIDMARPDEILKKLAEMDRERGNLLLFHLECHDHLSLARLKIELALPRFTDRTDNHP